MARRMPLLLMPCLLAVPLRLGAEATRPGVGVLDFEATGISLSDARVIGELFTSELVAAGQYDVVDRKNIEKLLAEQELQASDCTDSSCAVKIGRLLAADYMVYGSVGKLGESHVINVQLLNVGTGRIEGSAREKFDKIDEAYDVVHRLVAQLAQTPGAPGERQAGAGRATRRFFIDVAGGFVLASEEQGIEVGAGVRYVYEWKLPIGVGVGALLGLGFGHLGLRFGLDGYLYAKPFPRLAFSVGFRGLPIYIGFSGGLTLGVHFDKLFVRAYVPVIYDYGFGIDAGYTF